MNAKHEIKEAIGGFLVSFGSFYPDGLDSHSSGFSRAGVPYDPGLWFTDPITDAERKQLSRAARALEEAGLIERVSAGSSGKKTTHLRPTWKLVLELVDGEDPQTVKNIHDALYQSRWGRELGVRLSELTRNQDA